MPLAHAEDGPRGLHINLNSLLYKSSIQSTCEIRSIKLIFFFTIHVRRLFSALVSSHINPVTCPSTQLSDNRMCPTILAWYMGTDSIESAEQPCPPVEDARVVIESG